MTEALTRWAKTYGITTSLLVRSFANGLRGVAPAVALASGDVALCIPESLLINSDTALASDLGRAIASVPGVDDDTVKLLWTMAERHDRESPRAPFWQSLPATMVTGLSPSARESLSVLEATNCGAFLDAQEHVEQAWQHAQPVAAALLAAYPQFLSEQHFDRDSYMWAVQLWYAYSMQVKCTDGVQRECLVPLASLLNHSADAHIRQYGAVDAATARLELRLGKPCAAGEQLFLSYGALPNLALLLFYGFALPENPHDTVSLTLEVPDDELADRRTAALERHRGSLEHSLTVAQPCPDGLIRSLRILLASGEELDGAEQKPAAAWNQAVSLSSEQRVCASLDILCGEQLAALQTAALRAARQPAEALTPHVITLIQSQTAIWQLAADHVRERCRPWAQNPEC